MKWKKSQRNGRTVEKIKDISKKWLNFRRSFGNDFGFFGAFFEEFFKGFRGWRRKVLGFCGGCDGNGFQNGFGFSGRFWVFVWFLGVDFENLELSWVFAGIETVFWGMWRETVCVVVLKRFEFLFSWYNVFLFHSSFSRWRHTRFGLPKTQRIYHGSVMISKNNVKRKRKRTCNTCHHKRQKRTKNIKEFVRTLNR